MKAVITTNGAARMDDPTLSGSVVEYSDVTLRCARNITLNGKYIGDNLSIYGTDRGLIPLLFDAKTSAIILIVATIITYLFCNM